MKGHPHCPIVKSWTSFLSFIRPTAFLKELRIEILPYMHRKPIQWIKDDILDKLVCERLVLGWVYWKGVDDDDINRRYRQSRVRYNDGIYYLYRKIRPRARWG